MPDFLFAHAHNDEHVTDLLIITAPDQDAASVLCRRWMITQHEDEMGPYDPDDEDWSNWKEELDMVLEDAIEIKDTGIVKEFQVSEYEEGLSQQMNPNLGDELSNDK